MYIRKMWRKPIYYKCYVGRIFINKGEILEYVSNEFGEGHINAENYERKNCSKERGRKIPLNAECIKIIWNLKTLNSVKLTNISFKTHMVWNNTVYNRDLLRMVWFKKMEKRCDRHGGKQTKEQRIAK